MASSISYEFYAAKRGGADGIAPLNSSSLVETTYLPRGVANGVASLDADTKVPVAQLPDSVVNNFKGEFADEAAIIAAYATATLGDYAYNDDTDSYWYWNAELATPAWVNQEISATAYDALSAAAKAAVPYIVVS